MRIIQIIGMLSGIIMPLFNIPLILRITRRRSSADISLVWVIGVWSCVIAMLPSALQSPDPVLMVFGIINSLFFSAVLFTVLYFHRDVKKSTKAGL
jgi:uncharacterized protein with PQ loop repeat